MHNPDTDKVAGRWVCVGVCREHLAGTRVGVLPRAGGEGAASYVPVRVWERAQVEHEGAGARACECWGLREAGRAVWAAQPSLGQRMR